MPTAPLLSPMAPDSTRQDRWFWGIFICCSLLTILAMYQAEYPPMVDLPQHAAQIALWKEFGNPALDIGSQYEVNWFTPYVLAYGLTILLTSFLSVLESLRLVIIVSLIAFPLSLVFLFRATGQNQWLSLLGFSLAFGTSFYWGFFNFLVALPIGMLFLAQVFSTPERLRFRDFLILSGYGIAAFFGHMYVWMFNCGLLLPCIAIRTRSLRSVLIAAASILPSATLMLLWMPRFLHGEGQFVSTGPAFEFPGMTDISIRLMQLSLHCFVHLSMFLRIAVCFLLLLIFISVRLRPHARIEFHIPWIVSALGYLFMPIKFHGVELVASRFSVFFHATFLMAWHPDPSPVPNGRRWRPLLAILVLFWLCVVNWQFHHFAKEESGFDEAVSGTAPGKKVLGLIFQSWSRFVPGSPFLHFAAWNQVYKGGMIGF
ncbi:MAG TPA: hypothetical protein PKM25_11275, partial [Candidatus Ozemobacteraceae bacterium]|nr:hypothetical protein [Candidatus Ozemobacteraceae bacterium]